MNRLSRFMGRFLFRLMTNNNTRCITAWAILLCLLAFGVLVVGLNPVSTSPATPPGERELAYIRLLNPAYVVQEAGGVASTSRSLYWWCVVVWGLGSLVYTPIAFWDELRRGLSAISRSFRERRGREGGSNEPTHHAQSHPEGGWYGTGFGQIYVFIREVLGSGLADMVTSIFRRRRGG